MPKTDYVYVCSANFWRYLFLSMRSLFASGTTVECVTVYVTGEGAEKWTLDDPRIRVVTVPDIGEGYWGTNKTHLCQSEAERVVYLDTDVIILRPIDPLFENSNADLIARRAVRTYLPSWQPETWENVLRGVKAPPYPLYSPGFMIFQNHAHQRLHETWPRLTKEIMQGKTPLKPSRFAELEAFSIAASMEGLSHEVMPDHGHRYAMIGEASDDAVVYHLGTPAFYRHYLPLEKQLGLHRRRDLPVPRPRLNQLYDLTTRTKHRLKEKLQGARDDRLEY